MVNNPTVIITHHALSGKHHTVNDVDVWHKKRWPGFTSRAGWHVGYHFVIEWDGKVTQTREFDEEGAHVIGMNKSSIGVCFMGNFDNHLPSVEQLAAWEDVYAQINKSFPSLPIRPHRRYAAYKSCHGNLLSENYFGEHIRLTLIEKIKQLIALLQSLVINSGK